MFRLLRAAGKLLGAFGGVANYGRVKALRDQATIDLANLEGQRRILEEHYRPQYTPSQYKNSLARIEADKRRLTAKILRYQSKLDEIEAAADRRALEAQSLIGLEDDDEDYFDWEEDDSDGYFDWDEDESEAQEDAGVKEHKTDPEAVMKLFETIERDYQRRKDQDRAETFSELLSGRESLSELLQALESTDVPGRADITAEFGVTEDTFNRKYVSYYTVLQMTGKSSHWNDDIDSIAREKSALTEQEIEQAKSDLHQAILNRIKLSLIMGG